MKKWIALVLALVIVLGMVGCGSAKLSEDEQWAVDACISLKEPLAEPEAFRLYSDPYIIRQYERNEEGETTLKYEFLFVEYGGKNAYNAMVRKQAVFDRDGFICDYSNYNFSDLSITNQMKVLDIDFMLGYYSYYIGENSWGFKRMDKELIFDKVDISQELIEKEIKKS